MDMLLGAADIGPALRAARRRAGLSQAELGRRTGTSQATISAYENGRKEPSTSTLSRLLASSGARLVVASDAAPILSPSHHQHARTARGLADVLALAEALPSRQERTLRFPRLPGGRSAT